LEIDEIAQVFLDAGTQLKSRAYDVRSWICVEFLTNTNPSPEVQRKGKELLLLLEDLEIRQRSIEFPL
jgi:hypothetical protein